MEPVSGGLVGMASACFTVSQFEASTWVVISSANEVSSRLCWLADCFDLRVIKPIAKTITTKSDGLKNVGCLGN